MQERVTKYVDICAILMYNLQQKRDELNEESTKRA